MDGERQLYVYMLVLCMCRTLCSPLTGTCKYTELEQQLQSLTVHTGNICFCLCSLVSSPHPVAKHFPLSIALERAWIWGQSSSPLLFGPQTTEDGLLGSTDFQHVERWLGACLKSKRQLMLKPNWLKFTRAENRQLWWYKASTKLTGSVSSDKLSSQYPYAFELSRNIHACGGDIAALPVAGFVCTTGYAVHSDVLNSTVSPIFAM